MIRPKVLSLVRRSKLLVSPLDAAAIDGAAQSGTDAVVLDLGYATSSAQQPAARFAVPHVMRQLAGCGADLLAWVDMTTAAADVEASALPQVTGLLAQVSRPEDVARLDALLTAAERSQGLPQGRFDLELVLACAQAVLDAEVLAQASPRVVALSMDEEGVLADIGVEASADVDLPLYARGRTVWRPASPASRPTVCSLSAEAAPSRSASDGPDCRAFEARCAPTPPTCRR